MTAPFPLRCQGREAIFAGSVSGSVQAAFVTISELAKQWPVHFDTRGATHAALRCPETMEIGGGGMVVQLRVVSGAERSYWVEIPSLN
jgi:hypothetical protein